MVTIPRTVTIQLQPFLLYNFQSTSRHVRRVRFGKLTLITNIRSSQVLYQDGHNPQEGHHPILSNTKLDLHTTTTQTFATVRGSARGLKFGKVALLNDINSSQVLWYTPPPFNLICYEGITAKVLSKLNTLDLSLVASNCIQIASKLHIYYMKTASKLHQYCI